MTTTAARRSRATHEQLSRLVDFMYDNPGFSNKSLKYYGRMERDRMWSEVAEVLNSCEGPAKTFEQWQGVWKDLKSRTSIKVRSKKNHKVINGSSTTYQEPITELEKRVIAVIGRGCIESEDSGKDFEYVEELSFETPSTSVDTPDTFEPPQTGIKRLHEEEDGITLHQKLFMEIACKQADALKTLAEANAASAEVVRKQAETLQMLAECSAKNKEVAERMTESIRSMNEGINSISDAFKNLTSAINCIANKPFFLAKRKRSSSEEENTTSITVNNMESNTFQTACGDNLSYIIKEDEELQDSSQQLPVAVKIEKDGDAEINEG